MCVKGANLTGTNDEGISPIVAAASRGHIDVVRILLDKGVDGATGDDNGTTPFSAAQRGDQDDVVAFLNGRGFS